MNTKMLTVISAIPILFSDSTLLKNRSNELTRNTSILDFIDDYFNERQVKVIVIFSCTLQESVDISKMQMNSRAVISKYDFFDIDQSFTKLMSIPIGIIGVYLNYSCNFGKFMLLKSSQMDLFTEKYLWLIMDEDLNIIDRLTDLNLRLDSEVMLAIVNESSIDHSSDDHYKHIQDNRNEVSLYDLYKVQENMPIVVTYTGYWNRNERLSILQEGSVTNRRNDLMGITIQGISVITQLNLSDTSEEEKYSIIGDVNYQGHLDILNRYPFILTMLLTEMYNFTINVTYTDNWGFVRGDGQFDGLIGELQRGIADIGISPVAMNRTRFEAVDFGFPIYFYRPVFMFRNTRTFGTYEALLTPFKKSVWISLIVLTMILVFLLIIINHFNVNNSYDNPDDRHKISIWSESLVVIIATFCTQGVVRRSCRLPERILLYISLCTGSLLLIYYNSMIVKSLLQPPASPILTPEQLLESDLKIGVINITYYKKYFELTKDKLSKSIYERKLKNKNYFYEPEKGVQLMKDNRFAYYGDDVTMYPIIANTFTNDETCSLMEIELLKGVYLMTSFKMNFPLKRHINNGLHYLREMGIIMRERTRWYQHKPSCQGHSSIPSIQLQTLIVAYIILLSGFCLSLTILVLERMIYKRKKLKRNKVNNI